MYNEGISISGDLIDLGIEYDVIKKSGNSYTFGTHKMGVGRENAKNFLKSEDKLIKEIRAKILEEYNKAEGKK